MPSADLQRLKRDQRLSVSQSEGVRLIYLQTDFSRQEAPPGVSAADGKPLARNPFQGQRVRRALTLAIDRQALAERVMEGTANPTGQWLPPGTYSYNPAIPVPTATSTRLGGCSPRAASRTGWGSTTGEASYLLRNVLSTFSPGRGSANFSRYSNPALDALTERAVVTLDDTAREKILQEATQVAIDDVGLVPLFLLGKPAGAALRAAPGRIHFGPRPAPGGVTPMGRAGGHARPCQSALGGGYRPAPCLPPVADRSTRRRRRPQAARRVGCCITTRFRPCALAAYNAASA